MTYESMTEHTPVPMHEVPSLMALAQIYNQIADDAEAAPRGMRSPQERIDELLKSNNEYLEAKRKAEADLSKANQEITDLTEELFDTDEDLDHALDICESQAEMLVSIVGRGNERSGGVYGFLHWIWFGK